jgi:hypothetical protein
VLVDDGLEKVAEHLFGHVEVRDDAVLQGPYRDDAVRCAAQHALGLETDALDSAGGFFDGNNGGLVENDAFTLDVHQRVGCAQIHRDFVRGKPGHQIPCGNFHQGAAKHMDTKVKGPLCCW